MALLGQELMLCRAADQDLLREVGIMEVGIMLLQPQQLHMLHVSRAPSPVQASTSVQRQLGLLQQLLTLVPGSKQSSGSRTDTEMLLNELCASENVSQLSHMLTPTLDPWPSHIKYVHSFAGLSSLVLFSSRSFLNI